MLFILNNVNYNYTVYEEYLRMSMLFADTLKKLRIEKGLTQLDLAEQLFVSRTSVNRWENGTRLPDAMMIVRLSEALGVGLNVLFNAAAESDGCPNVIMLDDNKNRPKRRYEGFGGSNAKRRGDRLYQAGRGNRICQA